MNQSEPAGPTNDAQVGPGVTAAQPQDEDLPTATMSLIRARGAFDVRIDYPGLDQLTVHVRTKSAYIAAEHAVELLDELRLYETAHAVWQLDSYDDRPPKVIDRLGTTLLPKYIPAEW